MKSLNYIGSKRKFTKKIIEICQTIENFDNLTVADLFSGTGIVSYEFAKVFKKVYSNDLEYYAYVILKGISTELTFEEYEEKMKKCNSAAPINGIFSQNYSGERLFFTDENAQKIDGIRQNINDYFSLASLLVSADKVANTTSVYGAFLKKFKESAKKKLIVQPIADFDFISNFGQRIIPMNIQAEKFSEEVDIIYADPPYNKRQYGANYCPLNFLAKYENIKTRGKTGLIDYNKSDFSSKVLALNALKSIANLKYKYLILSYNNEGIINKNDIKEILSKGKLVLYEIFYNKYKSRILTNKEQKKDKVIEYLWFLDTTQEKSFKIVGTTI